MTDTPFISLMTAGICFFLMGAFGGEEEDRYVPWAFWAFVGLVALLAIPQIVLIGTSLRVYMRVGGFKVMVGPVHAALYTACLAIFVGSVRRREARTLRRIYLYLFYVCVALAALAKGILGVAIPGAVILGYVVLSWEWGVVRRAEVARGLLLFVAVAVPWYAAMFARHFRGFFERFFIHDHFKRFSEGVHQIDTGQFDHFILWLGLGTFPWVGFLPTALGRVAGFFRRGLASPADRVRLFVVLWFALCFTLFTVSSTKFHHYIAPALPPAAILVGLLLDDLSGGRVRRWEVVVLAAAGLTAIVGWNLLQDPQRLVNLFTYKYDREWPAEADFSLPLRVFLVAGLVPFVAWLLSPIPLVRRFAPTTLAAVALAFGVWGLNGYLPGISGTWSQKGIFEAYHRSCTPAVPPRHNAQGRPVCQEDLVSYKLNWRGETFYSENTVIPALDDKALDYYLKTNPDRPFYALLEYTRLQSQFKPRLSKARRDGIQKIHDRNAKFVLVRVPGERKEGEETR